MRRNSPLGTWRRPSKTSPTIQPSEHREDLGTDDLRWLPYGPRAGLETRLETLCSHFIQEVTAATSAEAHIESQAVLFFGLGRFGVGLRCISQAIVELLPYKLSTKIKITSEEIAIDPEEFEGCCFDERKQERGKKPGGSRRGMCQAALSLRVFRSSCDR